MRTALWARAAAVAALIGAACGGTPISEPGDLLLQTESIPGLRLTESFGSVEGEYAGSTFVQVVNSMEGYGPPGEPFAQIQELFEKVVVLDDETSAESWFDDSLAALEGADDVDAACFARHCCPTSAGGVAYTKTATTGIGDEVVIFECLQHRAEADAFPSATYFSVLRLGRVIAELDVIYRSGISGQRAPDDEEVAGLLRILAERMHAIQA